MRFVFIMLIFMSHVSYIGFPQFDFGGESGVAFFFMLSGFVLALRYGAEIKRGTFDHKRFFYHQFCKFYPLHIALIIISTFLNYRNLDGDYFLRLIPTVFLVQSWIPDINYYFMGNAVSWFLSDIIFIYAIFPFLYKQMNKSARCVGLTMAISLAIYTFYLTILPKERYNDLVYAPPYLRWIDFALGIIAARMLPTLQRKATDKDSVYAMEGLAIALIVITFILYPHINFKFHCAALMWPMSIVTILAFCVSDNFDTPLTRIFHWQCLLFCGTITFEIFLMHTTIVWNEYVVLKKLGLDAYPLASLVLCIVTTIIICWLTKRYFSDKAAHVLSAIIKKERL